MDWWQSALLTAVAVQLLNWLANRRNLQVSAALQAVETMQMALNAANSRIAFLETQINMLQAELHRLHENATSLSLPDGQQR